MAAPDFTPLLSSLHVDGIVVGVLSIAAALIVVLVVRVGAGQAFRMLLGDSAAQKKEKAFKRRYEREQRNREYRQWKRGKGY